MNLKNHDIGRIAGCLVIAEGVRELLALIVRFILGEEYGDVSFLLILGIALGIGLYNHWLPAYFLLLLLACLGELFVVMMAIEVPIKMWLGKISFPLNVFMATVESFAELYSLLAVLAIVLAVPVYFLSTRKAREESNLSKWLAAFVK